MMHALHDLLMIRANMVDGLLVKLSPPACVVGNSLNIHFYYMRIQDGLPRQADLIQRLCGAVTPYCIPRHRLQTIDSLQVRDLYLEARRKFQQPRNLATSGEAGEIFAYFMIEGCLLAPKVLSKMALKTNPQMPVHGSDGVHIGPLGAGGYVLYFAESKIYGRYDQAVDAALKSVREFRDSSSGSAGVEFELRLVENHLDVPPGELRTLLLDLIDPYSPKKDQLRYCHACLIGFEVNHLAGPISETDFAIQYTAAAKKCCAYVVKAIGADTLLSQLRWEFFFVPMKSAADFRKAFEVGLDGK